MYIIGLTGGIASGKSTVSRMLAEQGACIIDADKVAREIVEKGQPALAEIAGAFGPLALLPDGSLDRKTLGTLVFQDKKARTKLEQITHPRIKSRLLELMRDAEMRGCRIVVLDVPLLIEAGWRKMIDELWVVYVDKETQIRRLTERDGLSRQDALARIDAQMNLEDKKKMADIVIDNSGGLSATKSQVQKYWGQARVAAGYLAK